MYGIGAGLATVNVRITGLEEAEQLLAQLPIEIRQKRLMSAIRTGLRRVAKRASELAPPPGYPGDKPGRMPLAETMYVRLKEYGEIAYGIAGTRWPEGAHGHLVEQGTRPHEIRTKSGKTISHPGAVPHPFLVPAVQDSESEIKSAIMNSLKRSVARNA